MTTQLPGKLNQLRRDLPEGLLVDAAWLSKHGYATSLVSKYVAAGYLERPAGRVYRKPRGALSWEQAVISLQTLLYRTPLAVGGRTALALQGYEHYLPRATQQVHLYGPSAPPGWLSKLPLSIRFVFHNSAKLFSTEAGLPPKGDLDRANAAAEKEAAEKGFVIQSWGQWRWPLVVSSPERALLEVLDELPDHESFETADKLVESLSTLSPRRMQTLLQACQSVKAKRLLFFFADRHSHAWKNKINKDHVDLGSGKRMLVKGGVLDRTYQITVPKGLDAV
jgi:hypothetical protein